MGKIIKQKRLFWWFTVLLISTGVFWAWYFGWVYVVWQTDVTKLTSIISVIFLIANGLLGWLAYQRDTHAYAAKQSRAAETVWFLSEQVMALGMLGTVIGLIHMLAANFVDTNLQDSKSISGLLSNMWGSMGLALYTNAVGLAASILLKLQVYFIAGDIEDAK